MLPDKLPRKKLLILGSLVLVLLLALLIALIQQKRLLKEQMMTGEIEQEGMAELPVPQLPSVQVPEMTFATYKAGDISIIPPAQAKVYTFRSKFSLPYVSLIAQKFGLTQTKQEGNTVLFYNTTDDKNRGFIRFNLNTGLYDYTSYGNHPLPATGGGLTENVRQYLIDLGLSDETVSCGITYQRADIPSATFVECHRDWQRAGLPILNIVGIFNYPENKPLSALSVGMNDENAPENENIINVSSGQNGQERPNDFNTVTVAVDPNGNILKINSNLKLVEATIDFAGEDFISSSEALNQLRTGSSMLSIIAPVNDSAGWEEVFPNNTAFNLVGQVNDLILTYIEMPTYSKSLTPMYLARGTAQTDSGNQVRFVQAVPALRNQQSLSGEVAGLMAQAQDTPIPTQFYDESLKLGTFRPEQRAVPADSPQGCVPAESQLSPILNLGAFGLVGQFTIGAEGQNRKNNWFLIPAGEVLPDIGTVTAEFDKLALTGKSAELRELKKLNDEWSEFNFCPLRLTGSSPTLVAYSTTGQTYEVKVGRLVVYLNTNSDNSVYYEYQPVSFTKPSSGWTVDKANLESFALEIGKQLNLTSPEISKLAFELKLAASKVSSSKLFVGPVPQSEVDSLIPLSVTPQVPVTRYHFYVSHSNGSVTTPSLTPIVRTPDMVLEFGAVSL